MKTPINTIQPFQLNQKLELILKQAYMRRSRQLPANLNDIVETFKTDLLKHMPTVPIETVDDAVIISTLHEDVPLSIAFFFQAVKKRYDAPFKERESDRIDSDLVYWSNRLSYLTQLGFGKSPQAEECRDRINHIHQGDCEHDTIVLLDMNITPAVEDKRLWLNPRRMYGYLVMRGQIGAEDYLTQMSNAKLSINNDRIHQHERVIDWASTIGMNNHGNELTTKAMEMVIRNWLKYCAASTTKPSDLLTPLVDEKTYQDYRRVSV